MCGTLLFYFVAVPTVLLRKTGTWRDDAFCARRAPWLPPAPPPGLLRPCRHTPSPRAFRPQPFRTSQALSRRRFLRRGRTLGCACGALCRPCGRPNPRFRALWPAAATVPALFINSRFFRFAAIISEQSSIYPHGRMCTNRLPPALHHKAECSRSP